MIPTSALSTSMPVAHADFELSRSVLRCMSDFHWSSLDPQPHAARTFKQALLCISAQCQERDKGMVQLEWQAEGGPRLACAPIASAGLGHDGAMH